MRQLLVLVVVLVGSVLSAQEPPRLPEYVVSPVVLQPMVPGGPPIAWKPKVTLYASQHTNLIRVDRTTGVPLRSWCLVQLWEWKVDQFGVSLRTQALADPDITILESDVLDVPLGARATTLQTALNTRYNAGVSYTPAMTLREALHQLVTILSPDHDPTKFIVRLSGPTQPFT